MKLKKYKPVTPSLRNLIQLNNIGLSKQKPLIKKSIRGLKNTGGKNITGKITSFHKGGGHKKKYRKVNFERFNNSKCIVISFEYDPYRTAKIAAVYDFNKKKYYYILAPENLRVGDIVQAGNNITEYKVGNSLPLSKIPVGSLIHNINLKKNGKSVVSRSAGAFSVLIEKTSKLSKLELSSGSHRVLPTDCFATIGKVSNENLFLTTVGKAGRSRWLNRRPIVRGVAMNPIDHPHGGGEGKTSGGRSSVSPWGKPTKTKKN